MKEQLYEIKKYKKKELLWCEGKRDKPTLHWKQYQTVLWRHAVAGILNYIRLEYCIVCC